MHILQSKHIRLSEKETEEILNKLNLAKSQLPKIFSSDSAVPEGCEVGDVLRIERKDKDELNIYYRVVV